MLEGATKKRTVTAAQETKASKKLKKDDSPPSPVPSAVGSFSVPSPDGSPAHRITGGKRKAPSPEGSPADASAEALFGGVEADGSSSSLAGGSSSSLKNQVGDANLFERLDEEKVKGGAVFRSKTLAQIIKERTRVEKAFKEKEHLSTPIEQKVSELQRECFSYAKSVLYEYDAEIRQHIGGDVLNALPNFSPNGKGPINVVDAEKNFVQQVTEDAERLCSPVWKGVNKYGGFRPFCSYNSNINRKVLGVNKFMNCEFRARGCKNDVNISDPSAYGFYYHMNAPDGDAFQYGRWEGPYAKGTPGKEGWKGWKGMAENGIFYKGADYVKQPDGTWKASEWEKMMLNGKLCTAGEDYVYSNSKGGWCDQFGGLVQFPDTPWMKACFVDSTDRKEMKCPTGFDSLGYPGAGLHPVYFEYSTDSVCYSCKKESFAEIYRRGSVFGTDYTFWPTERPVNTFPIGKPIPGVCPTSVNALSSFGGSMGKGGRYPRSVLSSRGKDKKAGHPNALANEIPWTIRRSWHHDDMGLPKGSVSFFAKLQAEEKKSFDSERKKA